MSLSNIVYPYKILGNFIRRFTNNLLVNFKNPPLRIYDHRYQISKISILLYDIFGYFLLSESVFTDLEKKNTLL